ncbi:hypothetical protein JZ751_005591 [Albula glossodonta]|uniref:Autophagy-related protein 9 n=1 Tax=Albula glossodonta TaxID=121402 RepID=A0A8T2MMZ6_9TELE|nr:hypothetical protein JZ751_005591 [Albula glossodonta]
MSVVFTVYICQHGDIAIWTNSYVAYEDSRREIFSGVTQVSDKCSQGKNIQFLFVVTFTTFLFNCVEYDVLFANGRQIQENSWIIFLLIMAATFWVYRLIKVFCNILSYWEIRQFYIKA